VAVAFALEVGDELAYNGVSHPQRLSSAWPLAAVLTAGIAFRARGGVMAGVAIGIGRAVGVVLGPGGWTGRDTVSIVSTVVLYALAGLVAGFVTSRLREAERRISLAQAREEVARTLHDGVLQTLAVVQRRAQDADVVRLARAATRRTRSRRRVPPPRTTASPPGGSCRRAPSRPSLTMDTHGPLIGARPRGRAP
jgi:signal transduction histidine kinase